MIIIIVQGDQVRRGGVNKHIKNALAKAHTVNLLLYRNKTEPDETTKEEGLKCQSFTSSDKHHQGQNTY